MNKTTFILGAGFSKSAGLYTTSELTDAVYDKHSCSNPLDRALVAALRCSAKEIFGWDELSNPPTLEDYFTVLDASANSGHSLGQWNNPRTLRAVRRFLIYRIFSVLNRNINPADRDSCISKLLTEVIAHHNNFVVMNWDIVLEQFIKAQARPGPVQYGIDELPLTEYGSSGAIPVDVAKIHGSSNWVYCDNCRRVFIDQQSKQAIPVMKAKVTKELKRYLQAPHRLLDCSELESVEVDNNKCRECESTGNLGAHIATFSYTKSFGTNAFALSWIRAEQFLSESTNWVFIGYSLPNADFEFKSLLKSCELRRKSPPRIMLVTKNDCLAQDRYERFFGMNSVNTHQSGLSGYVAKSLAV